MKQHNEAILKKVVSKRTKACCPACGSIFASDATRCPSCRFTGEDSMRFFTWEAPVMDSVIDAPGVFGADGLRTLEKARRRLGRRFPQIRWVVCAVELSPDVSLPMFGFWLMNASPLAEGETREDRRWTVLCVLDPANMRASITPGYAVENWVRDDEWGKLLDVLTEVWKNDDPAHAIESMWKEAKVVIDQAWENQNSR